MTRSGQSLYVYVEGNDDEKLVCLVLKTCFLEYDYSVKQSSSYEDSDFISILCGHARAKDLYVVLRDRDKHGSVEECERDLAAKYSMAEGHIAVADPMIEDWYVSGSTDAGTNRMFKTRPPGGITKSRFDKAVGGRQMHNRTMSVIRGSFNPDQASDRSESFAHFYRGLESIARGLPAGPDKGGSRARRRRSP